MLKTYKPSLLAISALYLVSLRIFNNQIKIENNCIILKSVIKLIENSGVLTLDLIEGIATHLENSERHCMLSRTYTSIQNKYNDNKPLSIILPMIVSDKAKYIYIHNNWTTK